MAIASAATDALEIGRLCRVPSNNREARREQRSGGGAAL